MAVREVAKIDVIIIGAGISGLSAAFELLKKDQNIKFLVVEGKDRVGGRTVGHELNTTHGKAFWDLGGQWIGSCQPHIMKIIEEVSLETVPQYCHGTKVMQLGNNSITTYKGEIPSLPFYALIDLHLFLRKIEKIRKELNVEKPREHIRAQEWDKMTLEEALHKLTYTKAVREVITAAGRCVFGAEPSQMSFLYYLHYVQAAGGVMALISAGKGGGQEFKIKGGAFQICQRLMTMIGHKNVRLNAPVVKIVQSRTEVKIQLDSGEEIECSRVILALPPSQIAKIHYEPPLPSVKSFVVNRMPASSLTKVVVTYQTAFWRKQGFSGEAVTSGGPSIYKSCPSGPLCIVYDATNEQDDPALVGFIGGDQHIYYSILQADARKLAVLHGLAMLFGSHAYECLDYVEKNWNHEAYNGGCPVCVGTPGVMMWAKQGLRQPFHRLHFAGSESATVWCGFMNGAVQAGDRAANEVLRRLEPSAVDEDSDSNPDIAYDDYSTIPSSQHSAKKPHRGLVRWLLIGLGALLAVFGIRRKFFQI